MNECTDSNSGGDATHVHGRTILCDDDAYDAYDDDDDTCDDGDDDA